MMCPFMSKVVHKDYAWEKINYECEGSNCACYNINSGRCGMMGRSDEDYQTLLEKIVNLQNKKLKEKKG